MILNYLHLNLLFIFIFKVFSLNITCQDPSVDYLEKLLVKTQFLYDKQEISRINPNFHDSIYTDTYKYKKLWPYVDNTQCSLLNRNATKLNEISLSLGL